MTNLDDQIRSIRRVAMRPIAGAPDALPLTPAQEAYREDCADPRPPYDPGECGAQTVVVVRHFPSRISPAYTVTWLRCVTCGVTDSRHNWTPPL